jgi:hypothetical protein
MSENRHSQTLVEGIETDVAFLKAISSCLSNEKKYVNFDPAVQPLKMYLTYILQTINI